MEHEVSSIDVLHDKEEVVVGLKARVETGEKRRLELHREDLPLVDDSLHIVLLHNQILLETLDGKHLLGPLVLGQEHLEDTEMITQMANQIAE